jgi:hypothetical protein
VRKSKTRKRGESLKSLSALSRSFPWMKMKVVCLRELLLFNLPEKNIMVIIKEADISKLGFLFFL